MPGKNPLSKSASTAASIPKALREVAETRSTAAGERLTPARLEAYAELQASDRPLSAYELIALLEERQKKKIAPLTVYRHLNFLMRIGLVHRLESTQSYTTCEHPGHTHESQYLLCTSCGNADEVESDALGAELHRIAEQRGFQFGDSVVEIRGLCEDCVDEADD